MRLVAKDPISHTDAEPESTDDEARLHQAAARHAAHYKDVLNKADELYLEGGDAIKRGLELFDGEWPNIQAGRDWAAEQARDDDNAARVCSAYPKAGVYCPALRLHPRQHIQWLEDGATAARRLGDRRAEAIHLGNLGQAYNPLAEPHRAIEYLEQALEILREIGDRRGEGNVLGGLGNAYDEFGETGRAIDYHEQHLAVARKIGDRRAEGIALGNLGVVYAQFDERRAIECYERDLVIVREIGDRRAEGLVLGNLGVVYAEFGESRRAFGFFEHQVVIAREISDRDGEGRALYY